MSSEVTLKTVTINDKYTIEKGRVFISGTQALIRLLMLISGKPILSISFRMEAAILSNPALS